MSDGREKGPLTKMLWSVSIKTRKFASVNKCNGSFQSCLKLLKQYRTIKQMCSDAYSITLSLSGLSWAGVLTHFLLVVNNLVGVVFGFMNICS